VNYKKSTKGKEIIFFDADKELFSDESRLKIFFSDEAPVKEKEEEKKEEIMIPEIRYNLQRPSYVTKTSSGNLACDSSKEVCKINFDLRPSF